MMASAHLIARYIVLTWNCLGRAPKGTDQLGEHQEYLTGPWWYSEPWTPTSRRYVQLIILQFDYDIPRHCFLHSYLTYIPELLESVYHQIWKSWSLFLQMFFSAPLSVLFWLPNMHILEVLILSPNVKVLSI